MLCLFPVIALGQDVQVSRTNKTIAVTAEEAVEVNAEIGVLLLGYQNRAATKDAVYRENLLASERIVKALLDAGVPKQNIETSKLDLHERERDDNRKQAPVEFQALQTWTIRVRSDVAQTVVDVAVRAGANIVQDVEWTVADPVALEAKAGGAALAKARAIAEQMARGLGAKLGELIYASNRSPVAKMWRGMRADTSSAMLSRATDKLPEPKLTIFPSPVRKEATVHAVFAIE
jgi:uncharacterized protein YggE